MCGGGLFGIGGPATKFCPPLKKILCAPLFRIDAGARKLLDISS